MDSQLEAVQNEIRKVDDAVVEVEQDLATAKQDLATAKQTNDKEQERCFRDLLLSLNNLLLNLNNQLCGLQEEKNILLRSQATGPRKLTLLQCVDIPAQPFVYARPPSTTPSMLVQHLRHVPGQVLPWLGIEEQACAFRERLPASPAVCDCTCRQCCNHPRKRLPCSCWMVPSSLWPTSWAMYQALQPSSSVNFLKILT
ncbi:hypothetical protein ABBQ38_012094 [Trebouxia sp. C0009 RCD-2024]